MFLSFEKWHGCRNDFIVMWISDSDGDVVLGSIKRQAVSLCDRRGGIGADGVLVLQTKKRGELTPDRLTIINSDGSVAMNCGNGLRVAALSVLKAHREKGDPQELPEVVELTVEGAVKTCRFLRSSGPWPLVAVEMGLAAVGSAVSWEGEAQAAVAQAAKELSLPFLTEEVGVCEIGNPHVIIQSERVSREAMLRAGPYLQKGKAWDGMNVHLVRPKEITSADRKRAGLELGQPLGELFEAFVWERGAGETHACGSGACAIAACAVQSGLIDRAHWIGVDMPGGRLYVKYEEDGDPVTLAGPGVYVFSGQVSI